MVHKYNYSNRAHTCLRDVRQPFFYCCMFYYLEVFVVGSLLSGGGEVDWNQDEHPTSTAVVIPSQMSTGQVSVQ